MANHVLKLPGCQTGHALAKLLSWLVALSMGTIACPQTAGPEFPNPGNAHMSRESQRQLA